MTDAERAREAVWDAIDAFAHGYADTSVTRRESNRLAGTINAALDALEVASGAKGQTIFIPSRPEEAL